MARAETGGRPRIAPGSSGPALATLALLLALAGAGCAVPFRCPAEGGPPWRELTSEHFTVATDLPPDEAEVAVRDLEEYRAALMATAWPGGGDVGGRLRVVMLARERDWRVFERERDGLFSGALFQPFIALRAAASDQTRITIRHELTHHLSRLRIPDQPDWLAEGLATFFETMVYDRSNGELLIGMPAPARLAVVRAGGLSVPGTLAGKRDPRDSDQGQDNDRFYAASWLIVHYLISNQREPFARYLRQLETGSKPERAWSETLAHLTPDLLQAELRGHASNGRPLVASTAFRAPPFSLRSRPLDDPTVHALRALLFLRGLGKAASAEDRQRARLEARQALAADGHNLLALAVLGLELDEPIDLASAQVVSERHSQEWLAWMVLYRAAGGNLRNAQGQRAAAAALRLAAGQTMVKLPFRVGPLLFPALPAGRELCRPASPPGGGGGRCPEARPREDRTAELRAIAASEVVWCLFERQPPGPVPVTVEIDAAGKATSVCAAAPADSQTAACVQRVLAATTFPGSDGCVRRRRFDLALAPAGGITVFAR